MIQLDHLVLPVSDLGGAATVLESAGFVVTPRADHPFGTANRLVVFEAVYVELVGLADPSLLPPAGFARVVADHLAAERTGFSHFACRAASPEAAGDSLRSIGMEPGDPMWFSRPAPRSDGSEVTAGFTLVPSKTEPRLFFCIHHVPSAVWFRPHVDHPNGARRISSVTSTSPVPVQIRDVSAGPDRIEFDTAVDAVEIAGVRFG